MFDISFSTWYMFYCVLHLICEESPESHNERLSLLCHRHWYIHQDGCFSEISESLVISLELITKI